LPTEQQEMLVDLIHAWRIEERRLEIARDAQGSLTAFRRGEFEPQSVETILSELRRSVEDRE
jgi:hypothetical protein